MNRKLVHRGPDAEGIECLGPLVLGHRRLAIIDLSPQSNQPMSDGSGQYWIVLNGEIYNYLSLREELVRLGAEFRTDSDTEVALEAYKHWGIDCLRRFNGMFAFALWDVKARQLLLARDRLGKKPLFYYAFADGGLSFSSELKSLCEDPEIPRRLNPNALSHYLSLNYTLTAEAIIAGVRKLPPASYLFLAEDKAPLQGCYWDLATCFQNKKHFRSETEASEELSALIDDAVRIRLISDVPLGAFLSGGIDSSTIVASMCRHHHPAQVHTFSVGFKEKGYSELEEARYVAGTLGVDHQDEYVFADSAQLLPRLAYFADEPFADTSMIPTYLLAEFARRQVTVSLSGDGGDEIFCGYETYVADRIHHLTGWVPAFFTRGLYRIFDLLWPVSFGKVSFDYKLRQFLDGHALPFPRSHYFWRTIFSETEKQTLLGDPSWLPPEADPYAHFQAFDQQVSGCHYIDRGMYMDIKTWLVDDILVKVDRATMAHALEARAPLLDYRVVEFAASLPVELKLHGFTKKYILKKSQSGRLPESILRRPKKGFNAPVAHWLSGEQGSAFRELTLRSDGPVPFNRKYIETLWKEHDGKIQDNSLKLLGLIDFQLWCDEFKVQGI